jgi:Tfp pilus assembly protein PilW
MRRRSLTRISVITLTVLFAISAAAVAQEAETTPPKKKPTMTSQPGTTQTHPAPSTQSQPATQKGKKPTNPKEAGLVTVHGRIMSVHAEQNSLIIQSDTTQYQLHVTAKTQIFRDNKPADLQVMKANDRVDECHFNAKHVVQSLKVTSAENVLLVHPTPSNE